MRTVHEKGKIRPIHRYYPNGRTVATEVHDPSEERYGHSQCSRVSECYRVLRMSTIKFEESQNFTQC